MATSTELARPAGFDLTRAPNERWNEAMVEMVSKSLFRNQQMTQTALYFCLSVAEGLGLNPLVGEIYFIPGKSRDGKGPSLQPYIGRNGLVKKARERGHHFESETVRANDKFRMTRGRDGAIRITHSYGLDDRGDVVGAYAFLHDDAGVRKPAFFYARLDEYLPTFDADWKMDASPWGNQRSAMIEKCAMIGAARKRLDLGNVLMDGELASYEQQRDAGPGGEPVEAAVFDWGSLDAVPEPLVDRLMAAVETVNEIDPTLWPVAKLELVFTGRSADELEMIAAGIEEDARTAASRAPQAAPERSEGREGDSSPEPDASGEGVTDAQVVEEASVEHLRSQVADLERALRDPDLDETERAELENELDALQTAIAAGEDPGQETLPL